jgi:FixJ family two-component response regulator
MARSRAASVYYGDVHRRHDSDPRRLPHIEIFDLVADGFTSHAIAAKLNISVRTVDSYRAEVMEKMQAESVAGLVRQAIRLGRIAP